MSPGALGLEVKMREQASRYVVLVALLVVAAGAVWAGQPVNESRPVAPGAEISVENLAGSLTVEGSSGGMLEVTGDRHPKSQNQTILVVLQQVLNHHLGL